MYGGDWVVLWEMGQFWRKTALNGSNVTYFSKFWAEFDIVWAVLLVELFIYG